MLKQTNGSNYWMTIPLANDDTNRKIYMLAAAWDEPFFSSDRWTEEYEQTISCAKWKVPSPDPENLCFGPRPEWQNKPIPQYVERVPPVPICPILAAGPNILSEKLTEVLRPHLAGGQFGPVYVEDIKGIRQVPFCTYSVPNQLCIVVDRSPFARHRLCQCGCIISENGNAKAAILRRTLDDRLLYSSFMGSLYIDGRLIDQLDLATRFPKLEFDPVPLIDEPMDGDILPGDPGWNGTLTRRPIEIPKDFRTNKFFKRWSY